MARADVRPEALYAQVKLQDADPARTSISRGTKSSNPLPSRGESSANLRSGATKPRARVGSAATPQGRKRAPGGTRAHAACAVLRPHSDQGDNSKPREHDHRRDADRVQGCNEPTR